MGMPLGEAIALEGLSELDAWRIGAYQCLHWTPEQHRAWREKYPDYTCPECGAGHNNTTTGRCDQHEAALLEAVKAHNDRPLETAIDAAKHTLRLYVYRSSHRDIEQRLAASHMGHHGPDYSISIVSNRKVKVERVGNRRLDPPALLSLHTLVEDLLAEKRRGRVYQPSLLDVRETAEAV